jgi:hypothetical protein
MKNSQKQRKRNKILTGVSCKEEEWVAGWVTPPLSSQLSLPAVFLYFIFSLWQYLKKTIVVILDSTRENWFRASKNADPWWLRSQPYTDVDILFQVWISPWGIFSKNIAQTNTSLLFFLFFFLHPWKYTGEGDWCCFCSTREIYLSFLNSFKTSFSCSFP